MLTPTLQVSIALSCWMQMMIGGQSMIKIANVKRLILIYICQNSYFYWLLLLCLFLKQIIHISCTNCLPISIDGYCDPPKWFGSNLLLAPRWDGVFIFKTRMHIIRCMFYICCFIFSVVWIHNCWIQTIHPFPIIYSIHVWTSWLINNNLFYCSLVSSKSNCR